MSLELSFGIRSLARLALLVAAPLLLATVSHAQPLVNFESPHVHPLALSPDGATLAACNTLDNRVEIFDVATEELAWIGSIPVGYDPVSARFRNNDELWVVNHISDSISIVSLSAWAVVNTIDTFDEPCDVVFAGSPERAFVSCSQVNTIAVFDTGDLDAAPTAVILDAEDPRALAVSPDGSTVYAAIFESGNKSTVLMGSADGSGTIDFPPNVVGISGTPHGTRNPSFNGTGVFIPAKAANGTPPRVSLIVKQDENGVWRDDTGADWTRWVSGDRAHESGRPSGWTLLDHDIAVIDSNSLSVDYIDGLMNLNMAIGVNPATGLVSTVGSDGINEVRFEPNVNGIFTRVMLGIGDPSSLEVDALVDLNGEHLDYSSHTTTLSERLKSIGDPRAIAWTPDGSVAYVSGMGSNNLIVIDATGARAGIADTIAVGEGPTGIALDAAAERLFVLNRFGATVSRVDTTTETVTATAPFFDPTPPSIKLGRRHLFDTHATSGLGQASCASCHVDTRMDRLAWDLGDPSGSVKNLNDLNLGANVPQLNSGFQNFHPMKGPMTTQTMQDIIGHEPLHWRGDRLGIEEFNGAFPGLLGKDTPLTSQQMAEFKTYLATIYFPPNPFRNLDNTLPTNLDMTGHYRPGRFGNAGQPLPNGNAQAGMDLYRSTNRLLDMGALACVTCHTLPTGMGTDRTLSGLSLVPIPRNPVTNNNHLMLVSIDGSTNVTLKVPQLRNLYDKVGMNFATTTSRAGFGFTPDGAVDSIEHFVSEGVFDVQNDQEVANLTAFMLAFSGSDLPAGTGIFQPPGTPSKDAHAAVGKQVTLRGPSDDTTYLNQLISIDAGSNRIEAIAHVRESGAIRGYRRLSNGNWQSDAQAQQITVSQLIAKAQSPSTAVTVTIVPEGSGLRLALDRDGDGFFNYDELLACTDPNDPSSFGAGACEGEGSLEGEGGLEGEGAAEGEGASEGTFEGEGALEGEGEPVGGVDFCAIQDEIADLVTDPTVGPILFGLLGSDVNALSLLACDIADLNGEPGATSGSLANQLPDPNGILDGRYELAVLAELVNRPGRYGCLDERGGVDSHLVGPAFEANTAAALGSLYGVAPSDLEALFRLLIGNDLDGVVEGEAAQEAVISRLAALIPNIGVLLAGYATLGDDNSVALTTLILGVIEDAIVDGVGFSLGLGIDAGAYTRLNGILSISGDLDGDGLTQMQEYLALGGSPNPGDYLYAVLHTNLAEGETGYEDDCLVELEGEGATEGEGALEGEGATEGEGEGIVEGSQEGAIEGEGEGVVEGSLEGSLEGEGAEEGSIEGSIEGAIEGSIEGTFEGGFEGQPEGVFEGEGEDLCVFTVNIVGCIGCSVYVDGSFSVSSGFTFTDVCGSNHCYQPSTDPDNGYLFTSWEVNGGGSSEFTLCTDQTTITVYYTPIIGEGGVDGEGSPEGGVEGSVEGTVEGSFEGGVEGVEEGTTEGGTEGSVEGSVEGTSEGAVEGSTEGSNEGTTEGGVEGSVEGSVEGVTEGTEEGQIDLGDPHTADSNGDHRFDLTELLRVIQLYNGGLFGCDVSTEDGYAPGSSLRNCAAHSSDYNPFNWRISLSELLRVIQLFHAPRYRYCGFEDGEDQFCILN